MSRVVPVLVALLLTVAALALPRSAVQAGRPSAPILDRQVDQGIPLAHIDLRAHSDPLTTAQVMAGLQWWNLQSQPLLDQLTDLLHDDRAGEGWTGLYACAIRDGRLVVVVVGNEGRLGTVQFAADGTLVACDPTPHGVLPIVLPVAEGGFRPVAQGVAEDLLLRLRYLRERSPVAWKRDAVPMRMSITVTYGDEDPAYRYVREPLRAHGPCFVRSKPRETTPAPDPEPPVPAANN
jgi:hypothetical protein